jgi:threonyl-tRNA synthetase
MDLEILRHSTAHILAQAVKELWPKTKLGIGPAIEEGFYYDFDRNEPFVPEDLEKIERKMKKIVSENLKFERQELSKKEALKLFKKLRETYKVELINELKDKKVSVYKQGDFVDLCRGPHLESTGKLKAFKLTSIAGAYWRGSEKNKMLQRIYGTAFETEEELRRYLESLEEAKRRDHRRLGKDLELFQINEEIGPGLVLWYPNGALVRKIIEDFWKDEHLKKGYELINIPHIAKRDLWKKSGHLDFYQDYMYSPMDVEGQSYILKPMNCPGHILIYKSKVRSYRDLPLRWAELGTVYRYEKSGVLHGLMRVRGFTQDDAHIFCRLDQLESEIIGVIKLATFMLGAFGFKEYEIFLSTMPVKHVGTEKDWARAETTLKNALVKTDLEYKIDLGEGVFYGPKIDIKIKDCLGRAWQCTTIQIDFNLPERFNISFIGEDAKEHIPIMIHRALLGSLERFFGILLEHYAGALPLWLSPIQVIIIPIADRHNNYSKKVKDKLEEKFIRVGIDARNERLERRVREAEVGKVPYMLILGDKEEVNKTISLRVRGSGDRGSMPLDSFIEKITEEIRDKK